MSLKRSFAFFLQTQQMLLLLGLLLFANFSYADVNDLQLVPIVGSTQGSTPCDEAQKKVRSECHVGSMSAIVRSPGSTLEALYLADQNVQSCFDSSKECLKSCGYNGSVKTDDLFSFLSSLSENRVISLAEEDHYRCIKPAHKLAQSMSNKNSIGATCTDFLKKLEEKNIVSETKRLLESRCEKTNRFSKAEVKLGNLGPGDKCTGGKKKDSNDKCVCLPPMKEDANGKCTLYRPSPDPPCKDPNKESINGECVVKCQNGLVRDANGKCPKKPGGCKADEDFVNGKCVPQCLTGQTRDSGGACKNDDDDDDDDDNNDTTGGGKKENDKITKADFDKLKEAMDNAANNFNGGGNNFSDIGQVSYDNGGDFDSSSNSFDEGSDVPYGTAEVNVAGVGDSLRATIPRFTGDRLNPGGPQLSDPQDKDQPPGNNNRGGGLGGNPNLGGGGTKAKAQKAKKAARRGRSSLWAKAKQLVTGSFFGGAPAGGEENNSPAKKSQYQQQARRSGGKSKYFRKQDLQRADLQKLNESFHANMPGFGQAVGEAITDANLIRDLYADYRDNMLNRYGCEPPQTSCGVKRKRKTASSRKPSSIKKKRKRKLRRKRKRRRKR